MLLCALSVLHCAQPPVTVVAPDCDTDTDTPDDAYTDTDTDTDADTDTDTVDTETGDTQTDTGVDGVPSSCDDLPPVHLNEVVASNRDGVVDGDGDASDWFEIINLGTEELGLFGWTLSAGDEDDPWGLPDMVLPAEEPTLIFASGKDRTDYVVSWDTRIDWGDDWQYTPVPEKGWQDPAFDDSKWATGPSGFGRGDGDDASPVLAQTIYARTSFELTKEELEAVVKVLLHVDYDDGFVAYLNGEEIARANLGSPGDPVAHGDYTDMGHEAVMYTGGQPEAFDSEEAVAWLEVGSNLLAVEVHDATFDSSDLTLIPFLSIGFDTPMPTATLSPHLEGVASDSLHTDFKLSAFGETLTLRDERGCVVDQVDTGRLYMDESLGRPAEDPESWAYFLEPTPGLPNTTPSRPGFAPTPEVNVAGGHYPKGLLYELAPTDKGVVVRYTLDGREPTELDPIYDGGISIDIGSEAAIPTIGSVGGQLGVSAVVRARAFHDDLWPSRIETHTYLLDPGEFDHGMMVFSLVTEPDNLWDSDTGIYGFGDSYSGAFPYEGANFWEDWERDLHVEVFDVDGSTVLRTDSGVKIHGGWSRAFDQKSLRLIARSGYGDDSYDYPFFGPHELESFERLVLRNGGGDNCYGHFVDTLQSLVFRKVDGARFETMDYPSSRPSMVYLNGEFWGFYNLREKQDHRFAAGHHGVDEDNLDRFEWAWSPWETFSFSQGDAVAYDDLTEVLQYDLADPANYADFEAQVDTANFQAYLVGQFHAQPWDWGTNNLKAWRERSVDGRWRWFIYDTEDWVSYSSNPFDGWGWYSATYLPIADAFESQLFRDEFINRYADHLNTTLLPEVTVPLVQEIGATLEPAMRKQYPRWCSTHDLANFDAKVANVTVFMERRPTYIWAQLRGYFGLEETYTLSLDVEPAGAGHIALTAIEVDEAFEGLYFRDVPVAMTAVPADGYAFVGWSDPTLGKSADVELLPGEDYAVSAVFELAKP